MLTLTENASLIVREITARASGADEAGLRIALEATPEPSVAISSTDGPQPGDATVEQDGATVYLDAGSAAQLDDKVLDASVDTEGAVEFALGLQG